MIRNAQSCRILVAIASHGTAQDHFLRRVVSEYRPLGERCRIVVLSNINKPVDGAEVRVGVPTKDPYSLPFAHRALFAEHAEDFDLFIYTEDDTLLTVEHVEAFLDAQRCLQEDEIGGFLRSEVRPDGGLQIVSVNHHFRWLPETVVQRGSDWYASFSNQHSGCYMVTKAQLRRAIASGGFLVEPKRRRYGMLETAASDIYTQCGLRRLVNLTRIREFIVPHLANKYFARMGVPIEALEAQTSVLLGLARGGRVEGTLFDPETKAPEFRWSKNLYGGVDRKLIGAMPAVARRVLSVGSSCGANEKELLNRGYEVMAVPVDEVFAQGLESLGIPTVSGGFKQLRTNEMQGRFDVVLLDDVLHRAEEPIEWLNVLRGVLAPGGMIVGTLPVAPNARSFVRDIREGIWPMVPRFHSHGVHPAGRGRLKKWLRGARLEAVAIELEAEAGEEGAKQSFIGMVKSLIPERLFFQAQAAA